MAGADSVAAGHHEPSRSDGASRLDAGRDAGRIRLLYAEDDPHDADLARAHFELSAPDLELDIAETAEKCRQLLATRTYDALLLDRHLPDGDGLDILRQLTLSGVAMPIVMVTGLGDEEVAVQALRAGACDYVPKRNDYLDVLPVVMRRAVADHQARRLGGWLAPQRARRILYIEHLTMDVDLTLRHFAVEAPHFEVEVVRRSSEALERLARTPRIDLALADLRMPDMSALECLREARRAGIDVPFIIITGRADEETAVAALKLGAFDYLVKRENYLTQLTYSIDHAIQRAELLQLMRERQRVEEALRESEQRYRGLFEDANDLVFTVDRDGLFTSVNQAAERIAGYSREEALTMSFAAIVAAEHAEGARAMMAVEPDDGSVTRAPFDLDIVAKDGHRVALEVSTRAIVRDGRHVGIQGIGRDVTERRTLEAQLRQSQKMDAVGRLAGGIAHDFNNILTAILGYSDLVAARLDPESALRRDVDEIRKAGERAAALTRQLLAFSRKQVLQPEVLDLDAVVRNMEPMLRRLIGEDVKIVTVPPPEPVRANVDVGQLEQIILNLALNARDAMPRGGTLTLESGPAHLDCAYGRDHISVAPGPYVMLAVTDTGRGMDAETRANLFEPFFTTKERGKGTGLGLATVYGIVKQSGGYIWVYSEPDRGTVFKIYFPRVESPVERRERRQVAEIPRGSETILLVEDDDGVRRLATVILERCGYRVLAARGGPDALVRAEQHHGTIHLLLTDVIMLGMNGRELADRLLAGRPHLKVLFMSGYTDDAIVRHGVLEEGTAFLQKPLTPATLARKVRETLDDDSVPPPR